jgi:hypothetical protein
MSFSQEQGYLPATVAQLMELVRVNVNTQFSTDYDAETFLGTNFYKYFYALIQQLQENEIKTSEIVLKLQQYFDVTNEIITRPNTTHPGILDILTAAGYTASTKAPIDADAGKLYVCVDVDDGDSDYAAKKLEICTILKNSVVAGVVTQGTETEEITLSNGQAFTWKYNLPDPTPVWVKLTLVQSTNNQYTIDDDDTIAAKLLANIAEKYRLGLDFEPQRYFTIIDAPWAASVLLQWSDDSGGVWHSTTFTAAYDDLFTIDTTNSSAVQIVIS